jgi:hypothetical protein
MAQLFDAASPCVHAGDQHLLREEPILEGSEGGGRA